MYRVVVGTCFSLQKEHDTALKFFRRAIQLDAYNAYAHTLAAHEHVANEVCAPIAIRSFIIVEPSIHHVSTLIGV
jgi:Tfp pilus assembly protein PilF